MTDPVLIVDWGGYDYPVRIDDLAKCGVKALLVQAGGAGTTKLISRAKSAGLYTGLYWWNSALVPVKSQIDTFSKSVDALKPDFIVSDFEHWWASWTEYNDYLAGKRKAADVRKLSPAKMDSYGVSFAAGLRKKRCEAASTP